MTGRELTFGNQTHGPLLELPEGRENRPPILLAVRPEDARAHRSPLVVWCVVVGVLVLGVVTFFWARPSSRVSASVAATPAPRASVAAPPVVPPAPVASTPPVENPLDLAAPDGLPAVRITPAMLEGDQVTRQLPRRRRRSRSAAAGATSSCTSSGCASSPSSMRPKPASLATSPSAPTTSSLPPGSTSSSCSAATRTSCSAMRCRAWKRSLPSRPATSGRSIPSQWARPPTVRSRS